MTPKQRIESAGDRFMSSSFGCAFSSLAMGVLLMGFGWFVFRMWFPNSSSSFANGKQPATMQVIERIGCNFESSDGKSFLRLNRDSTATLREGKRSVAMSWSASETILTMKFPGDDVRKMEYRQLGDGYVLAPYPLSERTWGKWFVSDIRENDVDYLDNGD